MPKYVEIAEILKDEIFNGKYSEDGKLPTEYLLVERFNVSRQTVRQAISSLKSQNIVYQVQGSGTYVSRSNSKYKNNSSIKKIAVLCTYISEYIFPTIFRGIETELYQYGHEVTLLTTENKVDKERQILLKLIEQSDIDALIVEGTKTGLPNPNIGLYRQISSLNIPIIFLHSTYSELQDYVVVGMKDYEGGRLAAKKLIEKGCKNIGGIFKSDDRQGLLRYSGFTDEILSENLSLNNSDVRWFTTEDATAVTIQKAVIQTQILADSDIDGIVCYNDKIALSFLQSREKSDKPMIPIISFDKSYLSTSSIIHFDSFGHRKEELGKLAAQKALNMIAGKPESSAYLDWIID